MRTCSPEQWFGLHELRAYLLPSGALLDHFCWATPADGAPTAEPQAPVAPVARRTRLRGGVLLEQPAPQTPTCRRHGRQQIDGYLGAVAVLVIQTREYLLEALQRVGRQRELRERFTTRPRQTQLCPNNLPPSPLDSRGPGRGRGRSRALARGHRCRARSDCWERPLGHAERVARISPSGSVSSSTRTARARGCEPAANETDEARES